MNDHEVRQRNFYEHLRMHPNAHRAAKSFAGKIARHDPKAVAALKTLARDAGHDARAANALRILAITFKYEKPAGPMFAGGMPYVAHAGAKILRIALSPAAWALSQGGHAFHWAGLQLQHLAAAI